MTATDRLYYGDSELFAFSAVVSALREQDGRYWVALNRSAFYPDGGGQPADHGELGGHRIDDVQVDDDGIVWHRLAGAGGLPAIGDEAARLISSRICARGRPISRPVATAAPTTP